MPILWRPQLSVGNEIIDRDHKYLFCLINTVELVFGKNKKSKDIELVLDQLEEFAKEHFAREQKIQTDINFPYFLLHESLHNELMYQLEKIILNIRIAYLRCHTDPEAYDIEIEKLHKVLRHWILDHVLKHDLGMKKYFQIYEIPEQNLVQYFTKNTVDAE